MTVTAATEKAAGLGQSASEFSLNGEPYAERAYKELERLIITAELRPGEWITETALSDRLGISRTPIREALQRLARARLVEIVPRRGLRITAVNVKDQLRLLEFRRGVESFVATRAAERANADQRKQLRSLAVAMLLSGKARDVVDHYRVDLEYKLLLVQAAMNEYAADAITPLWAVSRRFAWVTRFHRDLDYISRLTADMMYAVADGDTKRTAAAVDAFIDGLNQLAHASLDTGV